MCTKRNTRPDCALARSSSSTDRLLCREDHRATRHRASRRTQNSLNGTVRCNVVSVSPGSKPCQRSSSRAWTSLISIWRHLQDEDDSCWEWSRQSVPPRSSGSLVTNPPPNPRLRTENAPRCPRHPGRPRTPPSTDSTCKRRCLAPQVLLLTVLRAASTMSCHAHAEAANCTPEPILCRAEAHLPRQGPRPLRRRRRQPAVRRVRPPQRVRRRARRDRARQGPRPDRDLDVLVRRARRRAAQPRVDDVPDVPDEWKGRATLARRADMLKIECIVRGYLSGTRGRSTRRAGR